LSPPKGGPYAGTDSALPAGIQEAVRLYRSSNRSIPKTAEGLGIASESLRRWIRRHEVDAGEREGLITSEREELSTLRREVRTLKQEREHSKRARQSFGVAAERLTGVTDSLGTKWLTGGLSSERTRELLRGAIELELGVVLKESKRTGTPR
jgi:transposase